MMFKFRSSFVNTFLLCKLCAKSYKCGTGYRSGTVIEFTLDSYHMAPIFPIKFKY